MRKLDLLKADITMLKRVDAKTGDTTMRFTASVLGRDFVIERVCSRLEEVGLNANLSELDLRVNMLREVRRLLNYEIGVAVLGTEDQFIRRFL